MHDVCSSTVCSVAVWNARRVLCFRAWSSCSTASRHQFPPRLLKGPVGPDSLTQGVLKMGVAGSPKGPNYPQLTHFTEEFPWNQPALGGSNGNKPAPGSQSPRPRPRRDERVGVTDPQGLPPGGAASLRRVGSNWDDLKILRSLDQDISGWFRMYVENHELDIELNTVIVKKNTFTFSDQDVFWYFFSAAPVLERERETQSPAAVVLLMWGQRRLCNSQVITRAEKERWGPERWGFENRIPMEYPKSKGSSILL